MENDLRDLIEKERVKDVINLLFIATDNRDWDIVKNCFAPRVLFDMTSMTGGEPKELPPQEITAGWEQGLKGLKAIHHQIGNYFIKVENGTAHVFCYGIALHYMNEPLNNNTRTFVGSYNFRLSLMNKDWKISAFKFNLKFITGNLNL